MQNMYRVIGMVTVTIVAVLGLAAVLHMVMSLPFEATSANDKRVEWVGAIGTMGTLIGTIWLATAESRRRKREQNDLAVIAGASVYHLIGNVCRITKRVTDGTTSEDAIFSKQALSLAADYLRKCDVWANEEIIQLVVAGNGIATDLAVCKKRFEWCIFALDLAASMKVITPEQCSSAIIPINKILLALQLDLTSINARINAFMPSASGFQLE